VIVRILETGQYRLADSDFAGANELDDRVQSAVEAGDEAAFSETLAALVAFVQSKGTELEIDEFVGSDAVVPGPGTTLDEARSLLSAEGLIPD
jgi:hypothetical protein